jgi:hypothetical protein
VNTRAPAVPIRLQKTPWAKREIYEKSSGGDGVVKIVPFRAWIFSSHVQKIDQGSAIALNGI